ncbi:hypothetical protein GLAREA_09046 [Glarea lozoyensis ATCC 20868]|uniref:Uncharacterized protein n=1 Tax=Glarea lozoyensis (strain ATCC 20868 / MF5171) TaxID=1116229 RepID=S3EFC5_GLAL2|nr:uncharacterized protein GLAREA_09046 [Glarea lozoyensis ATCC 20868]EPE36883.1 hypothetical protein GLAREA_09046 [Glarea lozoyensis ATCC 20868]
MTDIHSLVGWQNIFKCYPIFDNICAYLEPNDILLFQLTTKQLTPFFETLFRTQWNINRQLKRFVKDPVSFRSQLATYDALISGSFAVQFFERKIWEDSELDVYVEGWIDDQDSFDALGEYLVVNEGYTLQSARTIANGGLSSDQERGWRISGIKTYVRKLSGGKSTKIRIICTTTTPLHAIIGVFGQTQMMNIISWDFAYSLFPDMTFIKRAAYSINGDEDDNSVADIYGETLAMKYQRLGWTWEKAPAKNDLKNTHSLQLTSNRHLGDPYTWIIPLDVGGITPGKPRSVLQHSFFKVEQLVPYESIEPGHFIIHVRTVKSRLLRYTYTTSIHQHDRGSFWGSVEDILDDLEHFEISKFSEEEQETLFRKSRQHTKFKDQIFGIEPEGWRFFDDQIPVWYEEHCKRQRERLRVENDEKFNVSDTSDLTLGAFQVMDDLIPSYMIVGVIIYLFRQRGSQRRNERNK